MSIEGSIEIGATGYAASHWVRSQVGEQKRIDLVRRLVGGKMAYARQLCELVGRGDELARSFRCVASDSVVDLAPDE